MDSPPPQDDGSNSDGDGAGGALSSSDDDAEDYGRTARRQRRHRRHLENLYGSFLDDAEHDDVDIDDAGGWGRTRGRKRPRGGGRPPDSSAPAGAGSAPVFVRTSRAEDERPWPAAEDGPSPATTIATTATATDGPGATEAPQEEEDPEEADRRRQVREANERFWALLQKGRGQTRLLPREPPLTAIPAQAMALPPPPQPVAPVHTKHPGLGAAGLAPVPAPGSAAALGNTVPAASWGDAVPAAFGGFRRQQKLERSSAAPSPAVASWEKHTKGIGSKLLAKMGYSGRGGLQKKQVPTVAAAGDSVAAMEAPAMTATAAAAPPAATGIAQPIQVKVRPTGLGLGFGNFQEASALKQNRQIEAQVRGVKADEEEAAAAARTDAAAAAGPGASSALLPSVKDLMQEQSWRRGSKKRKKQKKGVVPFTELLEQQQASKKQVIIDMRGPPVEDLMDESDEVVPLGVELLHNISLLLSTYENKIYSASSFLESTKSQLSSIESDIGSITEQLVVAGERTRKLECARSILSQIQKLTGAAEVDGGKSSLEQLKTLLRDLGETFTKDERADLKFSDVLIPTLFASVVQANIIDTWKPLEASREQSKSVLKSILAAAESVCTDSDTDLSSLLQTCLLPKIKTTFESVRWNPMLDVDVALDVFELLSELFSDIDKASLQGRRAPGDEDGVFVDDSSPHSLQLVETAKEFVIYDIVYNKLVAALSQWKPQLDNDARLVNRIDLWILPWLPYLDHEGLLPQLVSECKRKVRGSISFLSKHVKNDENFFASSIETLRPWVGVLKETSLQDMVSSDVLPRLSRSIRHKRNLIELASSDWRDIELVLQFNDLRLLSDIEFLSLVEGELLWAWCDEIHQKLTAGVDPTILSRSYIELKQKLLGNRNIGSDFADASRRLYEDDVICRYFYSALLTMLAVVSSNGDLEDLAPYQNSLHAALNRRKKEEKQRVADEFIRMDKGVVGLSDIDTEARVRLHRAGPVVTFREVVEELANERGIVFQPKPGAGDTKDGKPVYVLGEIPIYFDSDVVFAYEAGRWAPVPLQGLMDRAK